MAFLWPMLRAPFLGTVFSGEETASHDARLFYDSATVALGLLFLFCESGRLPRLLAGRFFSLAPLVSSLAVLLAVTCLMTGRLPAFHHSAVLVLGSVLLVVGFAGTVLCWGVRAFFLDRRRVVCCLTLSLLVSFIWGLFDVAPSLLGLVCFGLPVGSAVSFFLFDRSLDAAGPVGEAGSPSSVLGEPAVGGTARACVLACMVIGLVACVFVRSLWGYEVVGYSFRPLLAVTYIESVFMSALLVAFALFGKNGLSVLLSALSSLMLLLVFGVMLAAFVGMSPALGVVATAHTLLEFAMLSFLLGISAGDPLRLVRSLGLFEVVEGATSVLTVFVIPRLLGSVSGSIEGFASAVSIASLCVVAVGFAALVVVMAGEIGRRAFSEKTSFAEVEGESKADARDASEHPVSSGVEDSSLVAAGEAASVDLVGIGAAPPEFSVVRESAAGKISEAFGLTAREAEVALLIGRGHSVKKAAELLHLSPNTVSSYVKIIYRKMGVHRRQDLVDIVSGLP